MPRDVGELVEAPEGLEPFQPRLWYWLCDLGRYGDEELRGAAMLQASLLVMKHIFRDDLREALPRTLGLLAELFHTRTGLEAVEVLLRYVAMATDRVEAEDIREALARALGPKGEEIMPTLAEKWIEEGREQGLQQGLRQGRAEILLRILEKRFGEVPVDFRDRVKEADLDTLAGWVERAFEAESIEDVFKG